MAVHRKALPVVASSTFVAIWTVWWAWHMWPNSALSWHFSVDGAGLLLHGSGLNLYADAPWADRPASGPRAAHLAWAVAVVALVFAVPHRPSRRTAALS